MSTKKEIQNYAKYIMQKYHISKGDAICVAMLNLYPELKDKIKEKWVTKGKSMLWSHLEDDKVSEFLKWIEDQIKGENK